MNICQCGCKKLTKTRYVLGHNGRGIPRSQPEIQKFKETFYNPEIRTKHIENIKKSWTPERKAYHSKINKGKTLSRCILEEVLVTVQ